MNKKIAIILSILFCASVCGQAVKVDTLKKKQNSKFNYKPLIIPVSLIGIGIFGIENDGFKDINADTKEELNEHIDTKFTIDDISQYAPFAAVYGLNAFGVKGKNNFRDRTIILGLSYLIMDTSVSGMKNLFDVERPDGSSNTSFPSHHTATAFMGAEFLYQEYKDVSIWYGISGYVVAAGTGFFRLYNDRHWVTDVIAGAGVGMLSTKIAYWTYPYIKRLMFKDKEDVSGLVIPFYNGNEFGLALSMTF